MIANFSLERVNSSPASFDPQKLLAFQAYEMQQLPLDQKVALMLPFVERAGWVETPATAPQVARLQQIVEAAGDRLVIAGDILRYAEFFCEDAELVYDEGVIEKRLRKPADSAVLLGEFRQRLAAAPVFAAAELEQLLKDFVAEKHITLGHIIHALRVAVTGKGVGFGMFETLEILGKDATLARIDHALARR